MDNKLKSRFGKVRIIFMDVDGVLNDGTAVFWGKFSPKQWNVRDRLGIKLAKKYLKDEIRIVWISGRPSRELEDRAAELGVDKVFSNVENKLIIMKEVLSQYNLEAEVAMYIGDDLLDLGCMKEAGVSCCPADAAADILEESDYVSTYGGGKGAVRQIVEEVLRARGIWEKIVSDFKKAI
ncbi:MAG: HAD hydrolase family protein [Elusimicrobia bacterium]|nr:HAD hydrolase family protein [Elusimicrobiota bacterium]